VRYYAGIVRYRAVRNRNDGISYRTARAGNVQYGTVMSHRAGGVPYGTVRYRSVPYRIDLIRGRGRGVLYVRYRYRTLQHRRVRPLGRVDVGSVATEICKIKKVRI
jgi:hypothetical protein